MSYEAWKMSQAELKNALLMGFSQEQIDDVEEKRREEFEEHKEAALEKLGLSADELETHYEDQYGFEHACHCIEDRYAGRMVASTVCEVETRIKALKHIEELNKNLDTLREQLDAAGQEPTV